MKENEIMKCYDTKREALDYLSALKLNVQEIASIKIKNMIVGSFDSAQDVLNKMKGK